jgi:hypothetical protein
MKVGYAMVSTTAQDHALQIDAPLTRDLYKSDWFLKARHYVESTGRPWFILSAKYGLVPPDRILAPHEQSLNAMHKSDRQKWARMVEAEMEKPVVPAKHSTASGKSALPYAFLCSLGATTATYVNGLNTDSPRKRTPESRLLRAARGPMPCSKRPIYSITAFASIVAKPERLSARQSPLPYRARAGNCRCAHRMVLQIRVPRRAFGSGSGPSPLETGRRLRRRTSR